MYKKFITPNDATLLLNSIDNINYLNDDLLYRIKIGHFNKSNQQDSIGILYVDTNLRKLTGMIFIYPNEEILADLEVIEEYRNRGIGSRLVKDAISIGAKYLAVNLDNKIAINIYKKCGFKEYYYDQQLCYMSLTGKPHPDDVEIINKKY